MMEPNLKPPRKTAPCRVKSSKMSCKVFGISRSVDIGEEIENYVQFRELKGGSEL